MDHLSLDLFQILFATALVAGYIDAIAGGGGLLTLPMLLWAGLSPAQALATNKVQGSFGTFSASLHFVRQGLVDLHTLWPDILLAFCGAVTGALLVQYLSPEFLQYLIPYLLILAALYTLLSPRMAYVTSHARISHRAFALIIGFGVGFYDGFFGPGTGSFYTLAFVALMGLGLAQATAHAKVLNFTSNIAALLFFAVGGHPVWGLGLVMGLGQFIGAQLGARTVVRDGSRIIRPLLFLVTTAMAIKLLAS